MYRKEDLSTHVLSRPELAFVPEFFDTFPNTHLYLVGGSVRDLLLQRITTQTDIDLVIQGLDAGQIEQWFSQRGEMNLVGRTFGVFKFSPKHSLHKQAIDLALPRTELSSENSEGGYRDFVIQADPTLSIETDLSRRDFTINAMAIDLQSGELIDPYEGVVDVQAKRLRTVGDPEKRFSEDLSRMMRALRFVCQLGFQLEEQTKNVLRTHLPRIHSVRSGTEPTEFLTSRETVGSELAKALASSPQTFWHLLQELDGWHAIFDLPAPEIPEGELSEWPTHAPTVCLALLWRAVPPDVIPALLTKTGLDTLPRDSSLRIEPGDIVWLITRMQEPWSESFVASLRASVFEKWFLHSRGPNLLKILDVTQPKSIRHTITKRLTAICERWSVEPGEPIPGLLSGDDFQQAGIPAGPKIREGLDHLRDAQLDGQVLTREQAKKWLANYTKHHAN